MLSVAKRKRRESGSPDSTDPCLDLERRPSRQNLQSRVFSWESGAEPAEDPQVSWAWPGLPFGRSPWKGRNEPGGGGGAAASAALRQERPPGWLPLPPPTSLHCKRLSQRRMELLEEDLTCPICCGFFDDPRALPCSHNFCRKCLEGILEGNTRNVIWRPSPFKCPTCRKETTVTGVNNLQVNYSLKGIVEKYNKIKISTKMPVCKVHSGQPLNIFCQTDTQLICGICATRGDHIKHLFCSIEDAYCQEKRAFETLSQVFEAWHCGDALSRLGTLETSKRKALQMLTKDYDRVKDFFEKLQYTLEQKKNEILSDFETMKLAVMQAYDPEINKLNTIIQEQQTAFNIAETFKDVSEPILFLQQMQEFREKIKVIKETTLPCITIDIKSTIKDVDTNQWEQFKLADVDKLSLPQEKSSFNWVTNSFLSPRVLLTALICLLVVVIQVCFTDFGDKTFQYWKTLVSAFGTGYLTDPTEMADHAILYWEKVADSAAVLSEKCVNYIHVLLNNVAQFVYMYKLL